MHGKSSVYHSRVNMKILTCIVVVALSSQGAVPGLVYCFDSTGHFEIENVAEDCCATDAGESSTSAGATSGCGPCTDTPISSFPVLRSEQHVDGTAPQSCCTFLPHIASTVGAAACVTAKADRVHIEPALVPVKSTVLLH